MCVQSEGHDVASLRAAFGAEADLAISNAMKLGWLRMDKETKRVKPQGGSNVADCGRAALQAVREWHLKDGDSLEDTENQLMEMLRKVDPTKQPDKMLQVRHMDLLLLLLILSLLGPLMLLFLPTKC